MKKIVLGFGIILSVLFIGCAGKFNKGNFENFIFERFDKNNDNKLSKKEYLNMVLSRFEKIDENKNIVLSKQEIKNSIFSNIKSNFSDYYLKRYDLNKDQKITKYELEKQTNKEFINLDIDNNGLLSRSEYKKQESPLKK